MRLQGGKRAAHLFETKKIPYPLSRIGARLITCFINRGTGIASKTTVPPQNFHKIMPKSTISQISDLFRSKKEAASQTNRQKYDEYLLTLRNDNTNADEAAFWIKCILYVLTAFVVYLGYHYYLSTFSQTMDPMFAAIFAVAIPAVVEIGKLKLITKAFRAISLGWIDDGPSKSIFWGFVLIIGAGAFWWSYTISTGGIKEVARQNAEASVRQDSLHVIIASATADVDARIAEINHSNEQAAQMKTKRGKVAWSGQTIQMNNSATLTSLQGERQKIVDQITADYATTGTENKTKVSAWSSFIERFGGWGEIGSILCLIALAVFERVLRDQNMADFENKGSATTPHVPGGGSATPPPAQNGAYRVGQNTSASPIGFYWDGYGSPSAVLTPQPVFGSETVPQSPTTVAQQNGEDSGANYADSVMKVCKDAVQRDLSNFQNRQASQATVSRRINAALDECRQAMMKTGFEPTYRRTLELHAFVQEKVWPTLNTVGWPYDHEKFFMQWLVHRMNEAKSRESVPA